MDDSKGEIVLGNNKIESVFFTMARLGIGNVPGSVPKSIDWMELKHLAERQGLGAIVLDGIGKLSVNQRPPQEILIQWIGETLQNYELRYKLYEQTIAELAGFYNSHGLKMMVLKGYACSLNWPKPEHRPCGDIDIWLFGDYQRGDAFLTKEEGIKIDNTHHHHSVFSWNGFMVENHYDFINIYRHKSNVELEKVFKELAQDDSHYVEVDGEKVYLPSPNLHTLFLLKHTMNDFTASSMNLRQILDWGFHVKQYTKDVDWDWLLDVLKEYHMMDFFNTINAICVENLGFPSEILPIVQFKPILKDRILEDTLNPKYGVKEPCGLIKRLAYKYRRWKGNSWKHELCYNESLYSAFWSGMKSHLLKPKSI